MEVANRQIAIDSQQVHRLQVMLDNGAVTAATVVESAFAGEAAPLIICGVEHLMDGPDSKRALSILVLE